MIVGHTNSVKRPAVLLTGFGPFPGVPVNETARLVPALEVIARDTFKTHAIHCEILPAEWAAAPVRLATLLETHKPVLALHFGVAQDATGFRIECEGHNACRLSPDAKGDVPATLNLIANGAVSQSVTVPVERIVHRLQSLGHPAYSSTDAGRYLCNAVLYHSLTASACNQRGFRAGFIHIPTDLAGPHLSFDAALSGSLEILKVCLEHQEA
jgi:pyroglutamyl-peptidase